MRKDPQEYLNHILECLRKIEIIGEAIKNLPQEFRKDLPHISWKDAAGLRNMIIHHYFEIDMELIWRTIENDLPAFKEDIKKLLL